jgi:predicted DNA-binding transcriptional regulator YafY
MAIKDYDTSLNRLIMILHKLWKNERPTIDELAEEFKVSKRTIQRDIYQRLCIFYIDKDPKDGRFSFLEGHNFESLLIDDEMLALALSVPLTYGSGTHMSEMGNNILKKLLHKSFHNPYFIKPEGFECIDMDSMIMNKIEDAIQKMQCVSVTLQDTKIIKIEPYKIIAYDGIWYLLGKDSDDGKIKNFFIHKILDVELNKQIYTIQRSISDIIDKIQTPWFVDAHKFEVVIEVSSRIAHYFELKKQLPSQLIDEKKEDGSLVISYLVSHEEEVDNLIKSWMPDIRVLKPLDFKNRLISEFENYLSLLKG